MEPGELWVASVIVGMILLPLTGTFLSALKGRPVLATIGGVATLIASIGVLVEFGNTEPGVSGLAAMGALLISGPLGLVAILGGVATATPNSWWWNHRYSREEQAMLTRLQDSQQQAGS